MKLHGLRYRDKANDDIAQFIQDLHGLEYADACDFYADIHPSLRQKDIALLGCNDRFFLLTAILGRPDALHPWLYDRCREVEEDPDGYLDLWAREHYKSTIITFAGIIQEIVRNPEITIGLFSFNKAIAQGFLQQVKFEAEANDTLRTVYADVFWDKPKVQARNWSRDKGLVVRRRSNPKESTLEAWGLVDGMPTSKHYQLLVYDDVVTDKTVNTPEQVQRAVAAWELSDNLGAGDVRKWHIGTRYSFADPYGLMIDRKAVTARLFPATDNGQIDGTPVFMSAKRWKEKVNTQRTTLAAQMLQNPIAGRENMFMPTWFRAWEVRPSILNVFIMGDPAGKKSKTADRTALAVIGIDSAGNKYLLDGYRHRMSLSERWQALKTLYHRWSAMKGVQMVRVGWERYGLQADVEYFQERMRIEGFSFELRELNWAAEGNQSKKARVSRLEPDFRHGRFYLPAVVHGDATKADRSRHLGDCLWRVDPQAAKLERTPLMRPTRAMLNMLEAGDATRVAAAIKRRDEDGNVYDVTLALIEEMTYFPFAPKDDLVDCVSRLYDMEPVTPAWRETQHVELEFEDDIAAA